MQATNKPGTLLADRFVVVLNETQDIVNIAGAVRAMLNTGLWRLRLVRPELFDAYRISGIAHGSENLLAEVEFYDTLQDALADTTYIVGMTARRRTASYVWQHPRDAAPGLITLAAEQGGPIALVFGREDSGLANEALDLCNRLLVIPTNPAHASLNLAHAVLLIGYELWLAAEAERRPGLPEPKRRSSAAKPEDLQLLFEDARRSLHAIEFFKTRNEEAVMRTVRAVARKAHMSLREAKLLRAIAIEVRKFLERNARS
jgi:TrmH family RNA methyltransferase